MSRPATPLTFSQQAGPSSPPETPTTSTFQFGKTNRTNRRHGIPNFSLPWSTVNGNIEPVGNGHHFNYNRSVRPEDISPRSSSPSSDYSGSPPRSLSSEPEIFEDETPEKNVRREFVRVSRVMTQGNFTIQELRTSDAEYDSDDALSVVQPDHYEDADSDAGHSHTTQPFPTLNTLDSRLMENFASFDCNDSEEKREIWLKKAREQRRKKRLSSGSHHKRTLSQSIGSDTDDEDVQPLDASEAGSTARRLRRKTGERMSLIFDDPPQRIIEELEPESGEDLGMQVVEPDIDVDVVDVEEVLMHALPYYQQETDDSMEVDSESESNSDSEEE